MIEDKMPIWPFFRSKRALKKTAPTTSNGTARSVAGYFGAYSIPSMPASARQAFELSMDPHAEARDFVALIQSDEALTARILKISNSVFYDRGGICRTIEEGVLKIGLNELRKLLHASTLADVFPSNSPFRSSLWAHDVGVAICAVVVASKVAPRISEVAFLTGLMHDIGKLLMLQRSPELYLKVIEQVERKSRTFIEAELEVFPFTHSDVGELIAEKWNFSEELRRAIKAHHSPLNELTLKEPEALIIKVADTLAHSLGIGHPQGFHDFQLANQKALPELWRKLHLTEADGRELVRESRIAYETEADLYISSTASSVSAV